MKSTRNITQCWRCRSYGFIRTECLDTAEGSIIAGAKLEDPVIIRKYQPYFRIMDCSSRRKVCVGDRWVLPSLWLGFYQCH